MGRARIQSRGDHSDAGLTSLPAEVFSGRPIHRLNLFRNRISELPPEIARLTSLVSLNLRHNHLERLPPEIGELTSLEELQLDSNQLTELPEELARLSRLRQLWLDDNMFSVWPDVLCRLPQLTELTFVNNNVTAGPDDAGLLRRLDTLWLNGTRLRNLDPLLGQLTELRHLQLSGLDLEAVPEELFELGKLEILSLIGNRIDTLPDWFGRLSELRELRLDRNAFTSFPRTILDLKKLSKLGIERNQIRALPPNIDRLSALRVLDVHACGLRILPPALAGPLRRGLLLNAHDNDFSEPIPELITQGHDALATYLESLYDGRPQFEAKMLVVGEGEVGKTSLLEALLDNPFVEGRPTTHGIEIRELTIPRPPDPPMVIRAWDFGGQEVYRITHQFFFSGGALYVLVWNSRKGQEQGEVEGWLRRIRLRVGSEVPVLVVATHSERAPEIDYPGLQRLFPGMLAGNYAVENSNQHGIPELLGAIAEQAEKLPTMGQQWSGSWIEARDEILGKAAEHPVISYEQFSASCGRHGLPADTVAVFARLLHDLGRVIYYGDDDGLRDVVVLNPEWLTKAISYVLEDRATRAMRGVLRHDRLPEIWGGTAAGRTPYDRRFYPYFLRLMEKFDVSYRMEGERESLVAQLVPHERPDLPWDWSDRAIAGKRALVLVCRLDEPAPGIVAWLTVRHHDDSTGRHWRRGVFLRHSIAAYDSEALLELPGDRELQLKVWAPSPDLYFNVLRDSIEHLLKRRWPSLKYQLLVPCPTVLPDGSTCAGRFKLTNLLRLRESRVKIDCQDCGERPEISVLLTGFATDSMPLRPQLEAMQHRLDEVSVALGRVEQLAADTAQSTRRVLRAINTEVNDCPRLFTLGRRPRGGLLRWNPLSSHYRLVLWCEHAGSLHACDGASYDIDLARIWLVAIGPYLNLIFKTLQLVTPIAAAATAASLSEDDLKRAKCELDLMKELVKPLPTAVGLADPKIETTGSGDALTQAEGDGLRAFRQFLLTTDPPRRFGGLRRVQAPSGDLLWVCPDHYPIYDPGLPSLPEEPTPAATTAAPSHDRRIGE